MKPTPHVNPWLLRVESVLKSLLVWCQERGFWRSARFLTGAALIVVWIIFLPHPASFAALVLGAALVAPTFVPLVVWPLHKLIDSIYLGSSGHDRPVLNYRMAERMLKERRYDDAAAEFERIAYWHPKESRAYCEGIRAAQAAGDQKLVVRLYRRGLLRCPEAVEELRQARLAPAVNLYANR